MHKIEYFDRGFLIESFYDSNLEDLLFDSLLPYAKTHFPDYFLQMLRASQTNNLREFRAICHLFSGAASTLGAMPLAQTLHELESCTDGLPSQLQLGSFETILNRTMLQLADISSFRDSIECSR